MEVEVYIGSDPIMVRVAERVVFRFSGCEYSFIPLTGGMLEITSKPDDFTTVRDYGAKQTPLVPNKKPLGDER